MSSMMVIKFLVLYFTLNALIVALVQGQDLYSSQPQPYVIPPGRVIDEYKRQLEDDIYGVERKLDLVAHRECIHGSENFSFCSLKLNILDFLICMYNPSLNPGSDAFIRGIKFPSSAFGATPHVAVGIIGIGTIFFGDVKVESKDVYASGFNIEITGGQPAYPYKLTIVWIACPAQSPIYPTVRDFTPKTVPPPPPYFPIREPAYPPSSGQKEASGYDNKGAANNQNQIGYQNKESKYEESSQEVDVEPQTNSQSSSSSTTQSSTSYAQSTTPNAQTTQSLG